MVKWGLGDLVQAARFTDVTEIDAWETAKIGPVTITATPAKHAVPEVTYILQCAGQTVFFSADSLRIFELDDVARRYPDIDLAVLSANGLTVRPLNALRCIRRGSADWTRLGLGLGQLAGVTHRHIAPPKFVPRSDSRACSGRGRQAVALGQRHLDLRFLRDTLERVTETAGITRQRPGDHWAATDVPPEWGHLRCDVGRGPGMEGVG